MAQRRMFSKDITEHDAFLDMPLSTQALYFHLGMHADDDGFVSPKKVQRMIGASSDDLHLLVAKKFVLQFEDGVIVIKHWKINNYLRNDRYKQSSHIEKMALISLKSNSAYTWSTSGIPLVDAGKDSIGKDTNGEPKGSAESKLPFIDNKKNNMNWAKQSDTIDEENVVDLDGDGSTINADEEEREKNKERQRKKNDLIDWLIEHQGREKLRTNRPKQLKALNELIKMKVSPAEIKRIILEMEGDSWWQNNNQKPDFRSVVSKIQNNG